MRKFICCIVCILVVFGTISYAESSALDVTAIETADLLTILNDIDGELAQRGYYPELVAGAYIVGSDIAVGKYVINERSEDEDEWRAWKIYVYKTETALSEYEEAYSQWLVEYNLADANQAAGNPYSYPADISTSDYYELYYLDSNDSLSLSLDEGEMMVVEKCFAENSYLTISKSSGLFMD